MDSISKNLSLEKYQVNKRVPNSERASLLKEILAIINKEREGTKYKPFYANSLGVMLSHIPTKDLYGVLSIGKDYKNRHGSFSKYLFGAIKPKK